MGGDMKFTLCCLFLFVAFTLAQVNRDCDIISGPYKCNDDIDVRLNLAAETMEVEYPDNACTYSARAFMHDDELIVTNVKCIDATDCSYAGFNCLPYIVEDIEFVDGTECYDWSGIRDNRSGLLECEARFVLVDDDNSGVFQGASLMTLAALVLAMFALF